MKYISSTFVNTGFSLIPWSANYYFNSVKEESKTSHVQESVEFTHLTHLGKCLWYCGVLTTQQSPLESSNAGGHAPGSINYIESKSTLYK